MQCVLKPGEPWRTSRGFHFNYGWVGDEPALFVSKGKGKGEGARLWSLCLEDAWLWRTKAESSNGRDAVLVMGAAYDACYAMGAYRDSTALKRDCLNLIDLIQSQFDYLSKMPYWSQVVGEYMPDSRADDDSVGTLILRANGDKVAEREMTRNELAKFQAGATV